MLKTPKNAAKSDRSRRANVPIQSFTRIGSPLASRGFTELLPLADDPLLFDALPLLRAADLRGRALLLRRDGPEDEFPQATDGFFLVLQLRAFALRRQHDLVVLVQMLPGVRADRGFLRVRERLRSPDVPPHLRLA